MKKIVLLVFVCLFSLQLRAQSFSEEELIGKWSVVRIHQMPGEIPADLKQQIKIMQDAFLTSKFHFKADKNFIFDFSFDDMKINNGHWKLNSQTGIVSIQEWKDKDKEKPLLMGMRVFKKDGKTIFMIEETFFAYEVRKDK